MYAQKNDSVEYNHHTFAKEMDIKFTWITNTLQISYHQGHICSQIYEWTLTKLQNIGNTTV